MTPGTLYLLGPGTTVRAVADRLGLPKTLLGVDAVRDRAPAGADLSERQILEALDALERPGRRRPHRRHRDRRPGPHLRPRQPAAQPRRACAAWARDNIIVLATQTKLLSLGGGPLLVDTGDEDLDRELAGYARVVTGLGALHDVQGGGGRRGVNPRARASPAAARPSWRVACWLIGPRDDILYWQENPVGGRVPVDQRAPGLFGVPVFPS